MSASTQYFKKRVPVRKLVSVVMAVGLVASLSACASGPLAAGGCDPQFPAGDTAALVTAKGKIAEEPQAEFPTPLVTKSTETAVLVAGDGKTVAPGDATTVQITVYDGATGDPLISTDYTGSGLLVSAIDTTPAFGAAVECATVGSRVAAAGAAEQLVGLAAIEQYTLPVEATDTVVLVVDVLASYLGKANGADQVPQAGYPSVVLAPNGRPGLTFPAGGPADGLGAVALKQGNGATVKEGDVVIANLTSIVWGAKTVLSSSWDADTAASVLVSPLAADGSGLPKGLADALIGQKVGSQLLVVVPPELGYPAGQEPAGVTAGDTLVYVFDILGITE